MKRSLSIATALIGSALAASTALAQFDVGVASDDVWVYRHSGNPGGDPVIRVWGTSGLDINPTGYPGRGPSQDYFSYGFMSWDLSSVPRNYEWRGATVTVTIAPDTNYDPATNDVYLRLITNSFDENTWVFGQGPRPVPGDGNRILGDDSQAGNGPGSTITFRIPRNLPQNVLAEWSRTGRMNLAITSTADFFGAQQILRIGSSENVLYEGPRLVLD